MRMDIEQLAGEQIILRHQFRSSWEVQDRGAVVVGTSVGFPGHGVRFLGTAGRRIVFPHTPSSSILVSAFSAHIVFTPEFDVADGLVHVPFCQSTGHGYLRFDLSGTGIECAPPGDTTRLTIAPAAVAALWRDGDRNYLTYSIQEGEQVAFFNGEVVATDASVGVIPAVTNNELRELVIGSDGSASGYTNVWHGFIHRLDWYSRPTDLTEHLALMQEDTFSEIWGESNAQPVTPPPPPLMFTASAQNQTWTMRVSAGVDYEFDWGDGSVDSLTGTGADEVVSHNYAAPGTYTIECSFVDGLGLEAIDGHSNGLTGSLPSFTTDYASVESIDFNDNALDSGVPSAVALTNLETFDISSNAFTGSFANCELWTGIVDLDISDNAFTGDIPAFDACTSLETFNAANNQLDGYVPGTLPSTLVAYDASFNALDSLTVNSILADFAAGVGGMAPGGTVTLTGGTNEPPTGQGIVDEAIIEATWVVAAEVPATLEVTATEQVQSWSLRVTNGETYAINWGDGDIDSMTGTGADESVAHNYAAPGTYTIECSFVEATTLEAVAAPSDGLTGALPDFTGYSAIESIDFNDNALDSGIPSAIALTNLETFDISSNAFTGSFANCELWTGIVDLDISDNAFSGDVPAFDACTSLVTFNGSDNAFTGYVAGTLPVSLLAYNLSVNALTELAVNAVLADFAAGIGSMGAGGTLSLDGGTNAEPTGQGLIDEATIAATWVVNTNGSVDLTFTTDAVVGTQTWKLVADLGSAYEFDWGDGNTTAGVGSGVEQTITHVYGSLAIRTLVLTVKPTEITSIDARSNGLTGALPDMSALTALEHLILTSNHFNDSPMQSFAACTNLKTFWVNYNSFAGTLPSFSACTQLVSFDINSCVFSGAMPSFNACTALEDFNANNNAFSGSLPTFEDCVALVTFQVAANNTLSGTLPSFNTCTALEYFDLSGNAFTDTLPDFGACTSLTYFSCYSNNFTQLFYTFETCTLLQEVYLALNPNMGAGGLDPLLSFAACTSLVYFSCNGCGFGGTMPDFSACTSLASFECQDNAFNDTMPSFAGLTSLAYFDASNNTFANDIPSFAGCTALQTCNLSDNAFSVATVPDFSTCTSLQTLDVSNNAGIEGCASQTFPLTLTSINMSGCGMFGIDEALIAVWNDRAFRPAGGTINLSGGTNAAPSDPDGLLYQSEIQAIPWTCTTN